MSYWITDELVELSPESIELLLQQKVPGIIIKDFFSKNDCKQAAERMASMSFGAYTHLQNIPVQHLGVCHNQWAEKPKSEYFSRVAQAQALARDVFADAQEQPIDRLIRAMDKVVAGRAHVAHEPQYGDYFAGAFRSFNGHGRLHVDHAPSHIKSEWGIKRLQHQLTWNVYLTVPPVGGELRIYDTVHTPENEKMKGEGDYYFPYEVLGDNKKVLEVVPTVGDAIIFNTQNFHEIYGNEMGQRISQTSFIGVDAQRNFFFWS